MWEHMPLPFFGPPDAPNAPVLDATSAHGYYGDLPRMAPLALGVLAALVVSDSGARHALARSAASRLALRLLDAASVAGTLQVHKRL